MWKHLTSVGGFLVAFAGFNITKANINLRGLSGTLNPEIDNDDTATYNTHKLEVWFDTDFINTKATARVMFVQTT